MPTKIPHTGIITDNADPEKRGRLCVECPTLVAGDYLEWVEPKFFFVDSSKQSGSFFVPNIGSQVEVEIDDGPESEITGLNPKWMCTIYPDGKVPEEFEENYPQRRGWKTAAGHVFYFDDTENSLTFYYEHPSGAKITVDNDGNIRLDTDQSVYVGTDADHPITRGDVLDTFLDSLKVWLDGHVHTHGHGVGTLVADPDTGVITGSTGSNNAPPDTSSTDIPADLNSDDHYVD